MRFSHIFYLLLLLAKAASLSTDSRWIVDEKGHRVKLACINWASHLDTMVAEGLSKQPVDVISKKIVKMGFNCVRLTWPLYLATNDTMASLTVRQSFMKVGLSEYINGLQANNPTFLNLSLINAFQAVVASLGDHCVMAVLDNHISKPGWCCRTSDGNGFFGDEYFNPDLWIKGLTRIGKLFKNNPYVIGMSLRNELRGPKQNTNDWYRYMQRGAEAVHAANPNVLVILSGLRSDGDLSFLHKQRVNVTFTRKLVFEVHWYSFTDKQEWRTGNSNQVCGNVVKYNVMRRAGFLLEQGFPLFASEFGIDLRGRTDIDNRYFNCFLAWAAEYDVDWALWTLVGSYYVRPGAYGLNENFGVLDSSWRNPRNTSFLQRISLIQTPLHGPGLPKRSRHSIIFHPATGLCILRKLQMDHSRKHKESEQLKLGPCSKSEPWSYTSQKTLTIKRTSLYLQAQGLHRPVAMTNLANSGFGMRWELASSSKLHLSTTLASNSTVCLDVDNVNGNVIITSYCKCLNRDHMCDPGSQWFKVVDRS